MIIYEIGTGYTSVPAKMGAATEIVVEELTKAFNNKSVKAEIIDIADGNRAPTELHIDEVNIPALFNSSDTSLGIVHKAKRVVYSINLAKKLKKVIRKSDNENKVILHFHNQYNLFFFYLLSSSKIRKKATIAYTVHSYIWHDEWKNIKKTIYLKYFQEVFAVKKADYVFVLNKNTEKSLIENIGCNRDKVYLVNNGVNTETYHPLSNEEIEKTKQKLGINNEKVFLQVGSVCDRKNQLGALKLLKPIFNNHKDYKYIYAGGIVSEDYKESILRYAKKNGMENQVVFLGELMPGKTLNEYYATADLFVFPSKSEGFSLVIIEAMAAGLPVIVNSALQFELSEECLTYSTKEEFSSIVEKLMSDEEFSASLRKKAREAVVDNYCWDKVADNYLNVLM